MRSNQVWRFHKTERERGKSDTEQTSLQTVYSLHFRSVVGNRAPAVSACRVRDNTANTKKNRSPQVRVDSLWHDHRRNVNSASHLIPMLLWPPQPNSFGRVSLTGLPSSEVGALTVRSAMYRKCSRVSLADVFLLSTTVSSTARDEQAHMLARSRALRNYLGLSGDAESVCSG